MSFNNQVSLERYQDLERRYETLCLMYQQLAEALPMWVMFVLTPTDAPSSGGIYLPRPIAAQWVPWIKKWPGWDQVVHIEELQDDFSGTIYKLWRLVDWKQSEPQRQLKEAAQKRTQREVWEKRYRVFRTLRQLRLQGKMSKHTALETVRTMLEASRLVPGVTAMLDALTEVPFSSPIDDDDYEDFRVCWKYQTNHVYEDLWDLTGND